MYAHMATMMKFGAKYLSTRNSSGF